MSVSKMKLPKYWKKWLYFGLAILFFIVTFVCFNIMQNKNTHINNYLVHTNIVTNRTIKKQHKAYLRYQAQQSAIANYHEMYNSFYLEMHPKIKNYKQLANDTKYMKMSNDTTKLNNHDSNRMADIKYDEFVERKHLAHEYRHSVWGNINNRLNISKFDHQQDVLKTYVIYVFVFLIVGLILLTMSVGYKGHVLKQTANELKIKHIQEDNARIKKEFGDNNPE